MKITRTVTLLLSGVALALCAGEKSHCAENVPEKIRVILDTDANNELDDQHAIAYMLFNGDVFDVEGITVNRTEGGGGIENHYEEARRVVELCGLRDTIEIYKGADKGFDEIRGQIGEADHDGAKAVDFIISRARAQADRRLVLMPVGKLTNIALAILKAPDIKENVRVVWLGSNYPEPREYNHINDLAAVKYVLESGVDFEIAVVRYNKPSGTHAVQTTLPDIRNKMPGKGPHVTKPVSGRHGGNFTCFGDYSVSLFENINLYGDPPARALYDMAAVAIVKNPSWAESVRIPAPNLVDGKWVEQPGNSHTIVVWENFDKKRIIDDFYSRMAHYVLVE